MTETYQQVIDRLNVGRVVPIQDDDSRVWLRWADKTLQPYPGDRTRREWSVIAINSFAAAADLPDD